jgi:pyrroloquinoline-quinone synthase
MSLTHAPMPKDEFIAELRAIGGRAYHHRHPFHERMNAGSLEPDAVRGWVANRFCYQTAIPRKDAAILSNCPYWEIRRGWLHRITDHDGTQAGEGGIEAWLRLGEACGLSREEMMDERHVLPGARFAVEAYVHFTKEKPWPVAVASSLTELFAPDLMAQRLQAFQTHYTWIAEDGLTYFKNRLTQAPRDSGEGLAITLQYCNTRDLQQQALAALTFKCDVLWSMLDAIDLKYGGCSR